jgi:hypothetical protein
VAGVVAPAARAAPAPPPTMANGDFLQPLSSILHENGLWLPDRYAAS